MFLKKCCLFCFFLGFLYIGYCQEFNANVVVNSSKLSTTTDKELINTLQKNLTDFINNRKWSNADFTTSEKIKVNLFLTLETVKENNIFSGTLNISASRPVYNSTYQSAIVNYMDKDIVFKYRPGDNIDFNELNPRGNDPLIANLSAIIAYWSEIIVGFYFESFQLNGGVPYFQKVQRIVTNAPQSSGIAGWQPNEGNRNRYWLSENLLNSRYNAFHQFIYSYYRKGLDNLSEKPQEAQKNILQYLENFSLLDNEFNGLFLISFIMQGKSDELGGIYKNATKEQKEKFLKIMSALDYLNIDRYRNFLDQ